MHRFDRITRRDRPGRRRFLRSRLAYSEAKTTFIESTLEKAAAEGFEGSA
jgi:hypothetical protein